MKNSITKSKLEKLALIGFSVVFWFLLWYFAALIIDNSFFLPSPVETAKALIRLLATAEFYKKCALTLLRVFAGLIIGVALGVIFAVLSNRSRAVYTLISPIVKVIKATPVASFIILFWVMFNGDALAVIIAVLMVMPIIWQNLIDGYNSIDKSLYEVSVAYEVGYLKRLKILVLPSLIKYFIPALLTACGLAWKSEIAAEIIAYTKNSIGQAINDAKYEFDMPAVFAWSVVIITFSILFEFGLKKLLSGRFKT